MKNRVGIICDSTAYLEQDYVDKYDIHVVNLTVIIDGKSYEDIVDIDNKLLFELMDKKLAVTTSQPAPEEFLNAYKEVSKKYDKIICLTVSSGLSGTYNSASIARDMFEGDAEIEVVDTLTSGMGIRACIEEILDSKETVFSKLANYMQRFVKGSTTYLTIDDLQTLVKTGRMKMTQALIGNALKVKPLLKLNEKGSVMVYQKIRTTKKLALRLGELINEAGIEKVYVSYVGNKEAFDNTMKILKEKIGDVELIICSEVGPVLSTHLGRGGLGLFIKQKSPA